MTTVFRDESTGKEFDSLLYIIGFKKKDAKGRIVSSVSRWMKAIDLATNYNDPETIAVIHPGSCRVSAVVTFRDSKT